MAFSNRAVKFTLKDIGSNVIDQLSSDIYTGPPAILREVLKNAYDSYLATPADELEDEGTAREIVISRERSGQIGRLLIADSGVGQTLNELKANVQISISRKPGELTNATGFRGLGSWATVGAGSKIVITTTKKGTAFQYRLNLDVRAIFHKMGPDVSLDDILNSTECVYFEEQPYDVKAHGTVVEFICDGPPAKIGRYELNRLYELTDPKSADLKTLLIATAPIPYVDGDSSTTIRDMQLRSGYSPTKIVLDGDTLARQLPDDLTELATGIITIGKVKAAEYWYAWNPKQSREVTSIDPATHLISGPGVQLLRINVPIGPKNMFSETVSRPGSLNWYVGEIHITHPEVLPNASGDNLRAGTAKELFVEEVKTLWNKLREEAEGRSERLSMDRKLKQGIEAAKRLKAGVKDPKKKAADDATVAKAVHIIELTGTTKKPKTMKEQRAREAAKDAVVAQTRKDARALLKKEGFLDQFASVKPAKKKTAKLKPIAKPASVIDLDAFQAKLGLAIPQLSEVGLSQDQIDEVLRIITEIVIE